MAQDNSLGARDTHVTWLNIVVWTFSGDRAKTEICGERGGRKGGRVGEKEGGRDRAGGEGREIL